METWKLLTSFVLTLLHLGASVEHGKEQGIHSLVSPGASIWGLVSLMVTLMSQFPQEINTRKVSFDQDHLPQANSLRHHLPQFT